MRLIVFLGLCLSALCSVAQSPLSGKVHDAAGSPLAGVSVRILNSDWGTSTAEDGSFTLSQVAHGKVQVEFSFVGFSSVVKTIADDETDKPMDITLQESTTQLDAVVVSAEKKEEELQLSPISISALTSRDVRQFRLWSTRDLAGLVPSLNSANPGDNRNVVSLRGITSTSYDPAIATYVDGVNQFSLDTYIAQLFEVERVEVLRGPQGTLYGRNAMGGVINIITRQPTNTAQGFLELNAGSYGQGRFVVGGRMPLIKDKLYAGATLLNDMSDGFYKNDFNNTSFDSKRNFTGNYYLKYLAGAKWSLTLNIKHSANRNNGTFPLAASIADALAAPFRVNQNAISSMHDNIFNGSVTAARRGEHVNFTSLTTYQSNYRYYDQPIDGDFSPIDGVTIINNYGKKWNNVNVWTQEFRFQSANASSPWQWTAGLYGFAQDAPNKQTTFFGADGVLVGSPANNVGVENTTTATGKGLAGFGQMTWRANERIDLTAGIRYDYEKKQSTVRSDYVTLPFPTVLFNLRSDTTASASFNAISPRIGLAVHVSPQTHVYANFSRGFRAGGLTQIGADPSQPPLYAYKPENSNNVEVSLKQLALESKLRFNVTGYYIRVDNAQIPQLLLPQALTVTRNAGKLVSAGLEIESAATVAKGLELIWNFGVTNAHYTDLKLPQNGQEVSYNGSHQIFTPASTNLVAAQYAIPVQAIKGQIVLRTEWVHLGKTYFDLANQLSQSAYSLVNLRAGVVISDLEVMAWVRNAGDTRYISYAYDFGAAHLGDPRNLGITVRKTFR